MESSKLSRGIRTPALPPDITFLIVANLSQDPRSLRHLSLVSKSWLHPSQRCLFSTVYIKLPRSRVSCDHLDHSPENPGVDDADDNETGCPVPKRLMKSRKPLTTHILATFAKEFPPEISNLVRKLVITRVKMSNWRSEYAFRARFALVDIGLLKAILHKLPSLHTLVLSACALGISPQHDTTSLLTPHPLRNLVLSRVRGGMEAFHGFFSQFEVKDEISIIEVTPTGAPSIGNVGGFKSKTLPFAVHHSFSDIRSLTFVPHSNEKFHPWRSTFEDALLSAPTKLKFLDAGNVYASRGSPLPVRRFVWERGQHLTHLRLDACWGSSRNKDGSEFFHGWNIGEHCPVLQVLHISAPVEKNTIHYNPFSSRHNIDCLRVARYLISSANRSTLRKVVLGFDHTSADPDTETLAEELRSIDAAVKVIHELDETFSQVEGLEIVEIQDEWPWITATNAWLARPAPTYLEDFLQENLVKTQERGILRLQETYTTCNW